VQRWQPFVWSLLIVCLWLFCLLPGNPVFAEDKITIRDRQGETWNITQAVRLGYKRKHFNYGLGRGAIPPLGSSSIVQEPSDVSDGLKVIGVARSGRALAVSVSTLTSHEVANVELAGKPIAVAY